MDAYLAACKAAGERPREDLAGCLGDSGGDGVFRLAGVALVRAQLSLRCPCSASHASTKK